MPAQAATTRREPTPKWELTNWQVRGLPSQGNNPRIESEPGWYLCPISFPKSVSELNPLLHCSLTKASVLRREGCSDYSRRGKRWKGQVSLSLCEISQQFLERTHYCLSFSLGSLKQEPSPRPSRKLTASSYGDIVSKTKSRTCGFDSGNGICEVGAVLNKQNLCFTANGPSLSSTRSDSQSATNREIQ